MIDWLVSSNSIQNRKEGLLLASSLLSEGYLQPAGDTSKAAAEGLSDTPFLDLSDAYYYFVSIDSGFLLSHLLMLCFSHASCWASQILEERLYRSGEICLICLFLVMLRMSLLMLIVVTRTDFFFSGTFEV